MSLRDRLASLSRGELVGVVLVVAVTLGGAGLWYARSLPKPVTIGAPAPRVGAAGAPVAASPTPSPATLIVDVAGEVRKPGVYEFDEGQRVIDALNAAGGPTNQANLGALNLAAPLSDGSQVLVPAQASAGAPVGSSAGSAGGTTLINVNTADATQLEELPGIGEVLAGAIVQYREEHGPFASVDQLDEVSGIGPATLENIRDLVTV